MILSNGNDFSPYVRAVKIKKSSHLEGTWRDIDHLFTYIARGTCDYYYADDKVCHLKAGDCIIFPPFLQHSFKKETNSSIVQYIVHFDICETPQRKELTHRPAGIYDSPDDIPETEKLLDDKPCIFSIPEEFQFRVERLFLDLFREFTRKEPGHEQMLKAYCIQLLIEAERSSLKNPSNTGSEKSSSWKIVERVIDYICLNYDKELSNEELSQIVNVTPNYLSKLFQKHTGQTLHNYLMNYRLEQARRMILKGDYNITEAAYQCGFSSIHAFSKSFKAVWGMSPSEYLKITNDEDSLEPRAKDYDNNQHVFYNV